MLHVLFLLIGLGVPGVALAAEKVPPVPVRTVSPEYPEAMKRSGTSGVVTIDCLIDERGRVLDPKVVKSSDGAFEAPALDALKRWKFKPATDNGTAVSVRISIPIRFLFSN